MDAKRVDAQIVVLRGGGDLATGVAQKLFRAGFQVLILEMERPTAIRRSVALSEAVYEGHMRVEDMECVRVQTVAACAQYWRQGRIPLLVDPEGLSIAEVCPVAVVDATLAKRNIGTSRAMAPLTIALGPGYVAGRDVDAVIETMRGHHLGRLILEGMAKPDTGVPGIIGGQSMLRVLRAPVAGRVRHVRQIGDVVQQGELLLTVEAEGLLAPFDGLLRGLIRQDSEVPKGMKIADVDPRAEVDWRTISDKARCLGGAVLEAILLLKRRMA